MNDSRLNESSQSDIWSDSREITMSTQEQVAKLTEIAARLEKMPSVPRIRIKQLELPEQWEDWKYVFQGELQSVRLDYLLETEFTSDAMQESSYKELNRITVTTIGLNVSHAIRSVIVGDGKDSAYKIWSKLIERFEGIGSVQAIKCFSKIVDLVKDRSGSTADTIATIRECKRKFDEAKRLDEDILWKAILVNSLPRTNETLTTILSTEPATKKLEELFSTAEQADHIKRIQEETERPLVNKAIIKRDFKTDQRAKQRVCFECGEPGHFKKQCHRYKERIRKIANERQSKSNEHSNKTVSYCLILKDQDEDVLDLNPRSFGKPFSGHIQQLEPEKTRANGREPDQPDLVSSELDPDGLAFDLDLDDAELDLNADRFQFEPLKLNQNTFAELTTAHVAYKAEIKPDKHRTLADSGANRPMFKSKEGVTNFRAGGAPLHTASGEKVQVDGIGDKTIISHLDEQVDLKDVVVCERLTSNILPLAMFDRMGYRMEIFQGQIKFQLNGKLMLVAELQSDDLYDVKLKEPDRCFAVIKPSEDDKIIRWHIKLSHISLDSVRALQERLKLFIPSTYRLECVICTKGKMVRDSFDKIHLRATKPLERIHTDSSGIIRIGNPQNYRYFIIFLDDFSRFSFIYLLKSKEQVFETFRSFVEMIEKKLELHIKTLKSDGGTEYDNRVFNEFCEKNRIMREFSAPRCPPQNGGSERMNRTVEQMARCLLLEADLPLWMWPFAVLYAIYIKNRVPHKAIGSRIPIELFHDTTVDYSEIHTFGCRVEYLVDDEQKNKFEERSRDGVFLGIPNNYAAYYAYSTSKRKVLVRRHVKFLEHPENQLDKKSIDLNHSEDHIFEYAEAEPTDLMRAIEQMNMKLVETEYVQEDSGQTQTKDQQEPAGVNDDLPLLPGEDILNSKEQEEIGVDQLTVQEPEEHQDKNRQSVEQSSEQQVAQTEQPPSGTELRLTKTQRKQMQERFPEMRMTFARPVNTKGRQPGAGIYVVNSITVPKNYNQIKSLPNEDLWSTAINSELESMDKLGVWKEVDRPANRKVLPMIWVFRVKYLPTGEVDKYKARLCVLGNLQDPNPSRNDYAPVMGETAYKVLMAFGVKRRMHQHHVDVQTAYLYSEITEEVYVEFPQGMIRKNGKCLMLRKSLYGLRSSALAWYKTMTGILTGMGFRKSRSDPCVFIKKAKNSDLAIVGLFVDDLLMLCDDEQWLEQIKVDLSKHVNITDKGIVSQFLNLDICYDRELAIMKLSQKDYIEQILDQFGMADCNGKRTVCPSGAELYQPMGSLLPDASEYMSLVGCLIYLSTRTRPDIKFVVARLCQFMSNPTDHYLEVAKHVLRYLKQTKDYAIYYTGEGLNEVQIDCDADYANDLVTCKSITGVCVQVYGNLVEWISVKQEKVARSTCEAELRALDHGADSLVYVRELLAELIDISKMAFRVYCDNESALQTLRKGGNDMTPSDTGC